MEVGGGPLDAGGPGEPARQRVGHLVLPFAGLVLPGQLGGRVPLVVSVLVVGEEARDLVLARRVEAALDPADGVVADAEAAGDSVEAGARVDAQAGAEDVAQRGGPGGVGGEVGHGKAFLGRVDGDLAGRRPPRPSQGAAAVRAPRPCQGAVPSVPGPRHEGSARSGVV
nr:hypothetical protein [Streptomyces griseus]